MKKLIYLSCLLLITLTTNAQLPSYLPKNGLIAWYPFDGNAVDSSGNGNNGYVNGATLTTDRFGNPNHAYSFNGISDYIHVDMDTPLNTTTISGLSMSIWCKLNSITTIAAQFCFYDSTNSDLYGINYDQVSQKFQTINGVNGYDATSYIDDTITPDTSSWYNLIYTCDYSTNISNLYFNGVFQGQNDTTLNTPILSAINIGRWFPGGTGWYTNGKINDVAIWNRVLSSQEIQQVFSGVSPCNFYDTVIVSTVDTLIIDVSTGIPPPNNIDTLKVYPNPTRDHVEINTGNYSEVTGYTIEIVNTLGQTVFKNAINQQIFNISLLGWAKGVYQIEIFNSQSVLVETKELVLE